MRDLMSKKGWQLDECILMKYYHHGTSRKAEWALLRSDGNTKGASKGNKIPREITQGHVGFMRLTRILAQFSFSFCLANCLFSIPNSLFCLRQINPEFPFPILCFVSDKESCMRQEVQGL